MEWLELFWITLVVVAMFGGIVVYIAIQQKRGDRLKESQREPEDYYEVGVDDEYQIMAPRTFEEIAKQSRPSRRRRGVLHLFFLAIGLVLVGSFILFFVLFLFLRKRGRKKEDEEGEKHEEEGVKLWQFWKWTVWRPGKWKIRKSPYAWGGVATLSAIFLAVVAIKFWIAKSDFLNDFCYLLFLACFLAAKAAWHLFTGPTSSNDEAGELDEEVSSFWRVWLANNAVAVAVIVTILITIIVMS